MAVQKAILKCDSLLLGEFKSESSSINIVNDDKNYEEKKKIFDEVYSYVNKKLAIKRNSTYLSAKAISNFVKDSDLGYMNIQKLLMKGLTS